MICRQPSERPSAGSRSVQSRVPKSGFKRRYVALAPFASSLNDASTTHEEEAASTLTLPPKRREREQAGGCQLLLFVAFLRGQSDILGSRSLVARPCRNHASPGRQTCVRRTRIMPQARQPAKHPSAPGGVSGRWRARRWARAPSAVGAGTSLISRCQARYGQPSAVLGAFGPVLAKASCSATR